MTRDAPDDRVSVEGVYQIWSKVNRCRGDPVVVEDSNAGGVTCTVGRKCEAETVLCVHAKLNHAYPGHRGGEVVGSGPTAPAEILLFLLRGACERTHGPGAWNVDQRICEGRQSRFGSKQGLSRGG